MTAVLADPVVVEQTAIAEACAGRRRNEVGAWEPCGFPAINEALRACHGITQRDTVCGDHTEALLNRDRTRCRACHAYVAVLLAVLPLGGAA